MNWGIISCGKISNDFCLALKSKTRRHEHKIVACAARSLLNAEDFSKIHDISRCFDSYAEVFQDPDVQIVYIGSINTAHFDHCKDAILAKKHVLCEKPMVLKSSEAEYLFKIAKENNVFLMEAMWSRFMPIYDELSNILKSEKLGKICSATANFTTKSSEVLRIKEKSMGGGGMYDLGVYTLQFLFLAFGDTFPNEIITSGSLDPVSGVDNTVFTQLVYYGKGIGSSFCNTLQYSNRDGIILGSEGSLKLCGPFHTPIKMEVFDKNGVLVKTVHHELPETENDKSKFIFGNSENLIYEADHVVDCVKNGELESSKWGKDHTIRSLKVIEDSLEKLGYYD